MCDISDTVQTLAAVALFAEGPTRVRGVAHNRHKETDRIGDLARELRKFGARVEEHADGLVIFPALAPMPNDTSPNVTVQTYNDHRMAMSLALIGLRRAGVAIVDPACTAKTYPRFWEDLARVTQTVLVNASV
jgi:3-phosphoshikimate 1-carboxyvinyltransferase